jgi:hypothetical protein
VASLVQEIVFSMLRDHGSKDSETSEFKELKHNDDLVPRFSKNLNYLVECCGRYGKACYDIQGVRDSGVDVLVKYEDEDVGTCHIGLQIKSYDDIKEKDWLTKLKAQILEATSAWDLTDFYIVFCTDKDEHKNKLRNASADIVRLSKNNVHVVEPEKALSFFRKTYLDVAVQVTDYYRRADPIIDRAKRSLDGYNIHEAAVVIEAATEFLLGNAIEIEPENLFQSELYQLIQDKYYNVPAKFFDLDEDEQKGYEVGEEKHEGDNWMELYDSMFFDSSAYGNTRYLPEGSWGLSALILDAKARHDFDTDTLKEYILFLLKEAAVSAAEEFLTKPSSGR